MIKQHTSKISMFATFVAGLMLASTVSAGVNANNPTLKLDEKLYFQNPNGEPTLVQPGNYDVQTAIFEHPGKPNQQVDEAWLRLTPAGANNMETILIQAKVASHEDHVSQSEAYILPTPDNSQGMQSMMLWTPDGRAYEAMGSKTGIFTRGIGSWAKKWGGKVKGAAQKSYRVGKGAYKKARSAGKRVYQAHKRVAGAALKIYNFASDIGSHADRICKKAPSKVRGVCKSAVTKALAKVTL